VPASITATKSTIVRALGMPFPTGLDMAQLRCGFVGGLTQDGLVGDLEEHFLSCRSLRRS
jgi:hypothetical protein